MKAEKGITLTILVITVIIMAIIGALLVRATIGPSLLKKVNSIEQNLYDSLDDKNTAAKSIEDAWANVI